MEHKAEASSIKWGLLCILGIVLFTVCADLHSLLVRCNVCFNGFMFLSGRFNCLEVKSKVILQKTDIRICINNVIIYNPRTVLPKSLHDYLTAMYSDLHVLR